MKPHIQHLSAVLTVLACINSAALADDPQASSWFTVFSGKYARVYLTDADRLSGNAVATWSRGNISQTLPSYAGVQEVASSANWTYIRTTGLGIHTMGP
ncbi:MAG: hypothetical protein FJ405_11355, partial [Verrucomicrobia bacterium]|nr:hypothetical protein [Verrucomicrobiota bacterium]